MFVVSVNGNWKISVNPTNYQNITVKWAPYSASGMSVAGYLITCIPIEDWHVNVSYSIALNDSSFGLCHNLVGYTYYNVSVYASVIDLLEEKALLYRSKSIVVRTQEGGEKKYI